MAKNETAGAANADPQGKTDKEIAAGYSGAIAAAEKAELAAADLKRELKEQAEAVAASAEERRRAQDKALYDLGVERQKVLDGYTREDAEREAKLQTRETAVKDAEDELLGMLKVSRDAEGKTPALKVIRTAFDARVTEADKAGEGRGKGIAKAEYETQKKLDVAEAAKDKALLEQENGQLKARNAALEKQVADLLAQQGTVVGHMKDLGLGALQASAGVQGKAVESLQTAAAGQGGQKRPGGYG